MIHTVSNIAWAGQNFLSVALINDNNGKINIPATMYLVDLTKQGKSFNTVQNYAYRLNAYFNVLFFSGEMDWKDVSDEIMTIYINKHLHQELKLCRKSLLGHISLLESFYSWAYKYGFIENKKKFSLIIYEIKKEKPIPKSIKDRAKVYATHYIEFKQFNNLLSNLKTNDPYLIERNEIILYLCYYMGLRPSEIINHENLKILDFEQIEENSNGIRLLNVIGKKRKSRYVPIPLMVFNKINNFINGRHRHINCKNLICKKNGESLNRKLPNKIFNESKIRTLNPYWDTRVFYSLRHTFATDQVSMCYEHNIDPWTILPDYMGHNKSLTTKLYIAFEAIKYNRHSILRKILVTDEDINQSNHYEKKDV